MSETTLVDDSPYALLQKSPVAAGVRITLVSGQPVMSSAVSGANAVIVTPYMGAVIPIYHPVRQVFSALAFPEQQIPLSPGTGSQQITSNANYDVYGFTDLNTGLARRALSPAWSTDTVLGSGPGSAERTTVAGILLNRWDIAGGPLALRGTYLGSVRTNSTSTMDWSPGSSQTNGWGTAKLTVYNYFNRIIQAGIVGDTTGAWSWTSTAYRPANGASTGARVEFLLGVSEDPVYCQYGARLSNSNNLSGGCVGLGLDSITSNVAVQIVSGTVANAVGMGSAQFNQLVAPGSHTLTAVEAVFSAGSSVTFGAFQTVAPAVQYGITYSIRM